MATPKLKEAPEHLNRNFAANVEKAVQQTKDAHLERDNVPDVAPDPSAQLLTKDKTKALWIEPTDLVPVKCTKPLTGEKLRERNYMWEYVEGIFENREKLGESFVFCMNPFPGDPMGTWTVPSNVLVAVPRWVAHHLSSRKYIKYAYKQRDLSRLAPGDFTEIFMPGETIYRTTFMPARLY